MIDERDLLERALHRFEPQPGLAERVYRRRDSKRRNQRIRAGVLGLAIAIAVGWLGVNAIRSTPSVPADDPTPTPAGVGSLAYALDGDIYVANPDGTNALKISHAPDARCEGLSEETYLSWSPDGRYLAFQRDCPNSEQDDMVITDPLGNVVGEFPTYGGGWGFTWSPDSTRVAVWEPALTIGVYGVDGQRQASLPVPTVTGGGNSAGPGWMPDGSAILLFGYAVVPLDGSAGYELSLGGLDPSSGGQATYSPDGTRVAVVTGNSITVLDAEGALVSEVDGRLDGVEAWSPDGEHFASLSHGELNVVDAASGTVTVLPEATAALDGGDEILGIRGFSPQGDRILYATGDGACRTVGCGHAGAEGRVALYSIGVDGSDARLVVAGTWEGDWLSPSQIG
jgi:Tol biopolymer transport system component